jgi:hypothetical protein
MQMSQWSTSPFHVWIILQFQLSAFYWTICSTQDLRIELSSFFCLLILYSACNLGYRNLQIHFMYHITSKLVYSLESIRNTNCFAQTNHIMWNIWKERNRHIFQHTSLVPATEVAARAKENIVQRRRAFMTSWPWTLCAVQLLSWGFDSCALLVLAVILSLPFCCFLP